VSRRPYLVFATALSAAALLILAHGVSAQSASGTITGRVLWGPCIRAIPLPAAPAVPDAQAQPQPAPGQTNGLPAGAVLVAIQNTAISARTDEAGRFTLSGAPAGQYLTVAAGPVADSVFAMAERPNVFVNGGQSVDLGTMSLGGSPLGIACRVGPGPLPGVGSVQPMPDNTGTTPSNGSTAP
jgi:hypothetical protein